MFSHFNTYHSTRLNFVLYLVISNNFSTALAWRKKKLFVILILTHVISLIIKKNAVNGYLNFKKYLNLYEG